MFEPLLRPGHRHDPPAPHLGHLEGPALLPERRRADPHDELPVADGHVGGRVGAGVVADARLEAEVSVAREAGGRGHVLQLGPPGLHGGQRLAGVWPGLGPAALDLGNGLEVEQVQGGTVEEQALVKRRVPAPKKKGKES